MAAWWNPTLNCRAGGTKRDLAIYSHDRSWSLDLDGGRRHEFICIIEHLLCD